MTTRLLFLLTALSVLGQGTITTIAGNGGVIPAGDGGPAVSASLGVPQGLAIDAAGNIYIAETISSRVRRIDASGVIRTFAGNGLPLLSGDGGPALSAGVFFLSGAGHQGLAVDSAGDLLIADAGNGRIRKVSGGTISSIAGTTNFAFSGDGGLATSAQLNSPSGITIDGAGNIFIADKNNGRIRKIDTAGIITTVAGNGQGVFGGDGGPATSANISLPNDVEVDAAGNLYIADGHGRIRKVDTTGRITTIAGGGFQFSCGYSGPATGVTLRPTDVALDAAGSVYIADAQGCVRRLNANGSISTVAGGGTNIPGDGGPATSAGLGTPAAIAFDSAGNLYIADSSAGRIRKVTIAPAVSGVVPAIAAGGIVNAASFLATEISPGSIISIFGSGFGAAVSVASTVPLPTSLGGTRVLINGIDAPLFAVTPTQINAQVPWQLHSPAITAANVEVVTSGGTSPARMIVFGDRPGIFTTQQNGQGPGIITHANGALVTLANPAANNEVLVMYCTGLGAVTNQPASGGLSPSGPLAVSVVTPNVTIGNLAARVLFAGLAPGYIGLYQVNVEVPSNARPLAGDPDGPVVRVSMTVGSMLGNVVTLPLR
jgi:uncharacterized protein (TIGR03437 family)